MSPDPFADGLDPTQEWDETGPPSPGDRVQVRLTGRVSEVRLTAGQPMVLVALDTEQVQRDEFGWLSIWESAERVAVVDRTPEPGVQES
jgi:hypothetical protein